ncbi:phospholipase [Variovorax sp. PAMC 28711]|nr:phospholipase [Variovorax sp. PAMC 28711]
MKRWSLLIGVAALSACAQLPKDVQRPVSHALASPAETPLGALAQQRHDAAGARFDSGFLLLDGPQAAYGSRLALVEGARKTLDLQYYAIHADASTGRLLRAIRDAAARGVRVRILIDDFHSTGRDALVLLLGFETNVEMRLFNPLAGDRDSTFSRLANSLSEASRVQQRMHNKLFIADNAMGVTGGRNLGDAYFGNAKAGNFVDLDVLAAGPIVQDLSRSFDAYWNNERSYPVQSLVTKEELQEMRNRVRPPAGPNGERPADSGGPTPEQRAFAWDEKPLDLASARFVWAPAVVMADKPAKIAPDTTSPDAGAGKAPAMVISQQQDNAGSPRTAALDASADLAAGSETVVEGLLQLIGQARRDLLIISPYFVPGDDMKQAFAAARARGVRVRVLTNSLASNDAPVAHVGYARHREELLAMGVELYEMRSEQAGVGKAFGSSGSGSGVTGQSRAMLHAKVLVLDGRLLVVGSMNLDLRSQLQNTEVALLIQSSELSRIATSQIETALREGAWHVESVDGQLTWRAPEGSGLQDSTTEPDASASLRLLLKLFGPLAPDKLL